MEIIVAKNGGFCHGVKNSVDTALSISPENTYIFGEIIHNLEVVKKIASRGIPTVERLVDVPQGATLIIRSHGVGKDVYPGECDFFHKTARGLKLFFGFTGESNHHVGG